MREEDGRLREGSLVEKIQKFSKFEINLVLLVVKPIDKTARLFYNMGELNVTIQMHLNSLSPTLAHANGIFLMSVV